MCHRVKTIAKNCDGSLSFCESCNIYHLTFNNLYIEFTPKEMKSFQKFVSEIEIDYWETKYERSVMKRKIPINTLQRNLSMIFNKQEIQSLKNLILLNTKPPFSKLSALDIDYIYFLN